ncbi:hypothetical protein FRC19_007236 [Serendipita sp. 401]|nr:hypothetical protein FRC19_007236 [Serendipita sp. 401]
MAAPNPDTPTTPPSNHDSSAIPIPIIDDEPVPAPIPHVPAASRCGTHQRYMPKEFWRADAPLILQAPRPDTPPSPSPSTSVHQPLVEDSPASDDESESSDDPLAMEALEQSLLTLAGIDKEYVHFTIDQAIQYAHSAGVVSDPDSPTYKEAMKGTDKDKWMAACLDEICAHTENGT